MNTLQILFIPTTEFHFWKGSGLHQKKLLWLLNQRPVYTASYRSIAKISLRHLPSHLLYFSGLLYSFTDPFCEHTSDIARTNNWISPWEGSGLHLKKLLWLLNQRPVYNASYRPIAKKSLRHLPSHLLYFSSLLYTFTDPFCEHTKVTVRTYSQISFWRGSGLHIKWSKKVALTSESMTRFTLCLIRLSQINSYGIFHRIFYTLVVCYIALLTLFVITLQILFGTSNKFYFCKAPDYICWALKKLFWLLDQRPVYTASFCILQRNPWGTIHHIFFTLAVYCVDLLTLFESTLQLLFGPTTEFYFCRAPD